MRNNRSITHPALFFSLALLLVVQALCARASAQEDSASTTESSGTEATDEAAPLFLRLLRDENNQPIAMETSIVTYMPADGADGPIIDLIGAVHIGDADYYAELNEQFPTYEALLYELVTPENDPDGIPTGEGRRRHPVAGMQSMMQNMLELSHQLQEVDYSAENFVHADMTIEQFNETMAERGESWLQMYFRAMGQSMAAQSGGGSNDIDVLMALFSTDRPLRLKRIMAEQFESMEGAIDAFSGEDGSTIITERNGRALEVLDEELEAGRSRIGIFYGAGHMADFDERLIRDYGLQRGEVRWIVAWDLTSDKSARETLAAEQESDEAPSDSAAPAAEEEALVPAG